MGEMNMNIRLLFFIAILGLITLPLVSCSKVHAMNTPVPSTSTNTSSPASTSTLIIPVPKVATEIPEQSASTIGYTSVAAALTALQARKDVSISVQSGWTIITESGGLTIWSFAPRDNPAYPAVAKRVLYQEQGAWKLMMYIRCEADKASCDKFVQNFEALNIQMEQAINQGHNP
jgi:hypothetical protein